MLKRLVLNCSLALLVELLHLQCSIGSDLAKVISEYKPTVRLAVAARQARLLLIDNKISRTSTSDPNIVAPIVVAENQIFLIGNNEGSATVFLWNDIGKVIGIQVDVFKPGFPFKKEQSLIPEFSGHDMHFEETSMTNADVQTFTAAEKTFTHLANNRPYDISFLKYL